MTQLVQFINLICPLGIWAHFGPDFEKCGKNVKQAPICAKFYGQLALNALFNFNVFNFCKKSPPNTNKHVINTPGSFGNSFRGQIWPYPNLIKLN